MNYDLLPFTLAQAGDVPQDAPPVVPDSPQGLSLEDQYVPGTQTQQPIPAPGNPPGQQQPPSLMQGLSQMLPFILIFVVIIVLMTGGQRREKKRRASMLGALKKGDRVQTIGGVIGNVVEMRENDVVLKVDENSNTRIRFAKAAIQSVIAEKEA